jgi:signal transduction histidine kinase
VAIFSHEIKTPLAVIKSSAESLQMANPVADEATQKRLGRIVSAAKRINLLAEQFLRKDELEEDGYEPERQSFDLSPCVAEAVAEVDHEGRVQLELPAHEVGWHGDRLLIAILVSNLVGNALKYSPTDQPVRITLSPEQGRWVLCVHDQGPGIDPQQLPHIFNSYYRGQRDGAVSGSGLGLYLVQRIAQLHGARVQAQSSLGQGSVFSVHFPAAKP